MRAEIGRLIACEDDLRELLVIQRDRIRQLEAVDPELRAIELDYRRFALAHQQRAFWWQLLVGYAFSAVLLGLILFGMYLSWRQFRGADMPRPREAPQEAEIEISIERIKVRSALVGVLLLSIAFAFTVAFFVLVFEIRIVSAE